MCPKILDDTGAAGRDIGGIGGETGGPMKILVILGHPQKGSFNHAIAETVVITLQTNGQEVYFHDLYEDKCLQRPA